MLAKITGVIELTGFTEKEEHEIKKKLELENPDYYKKIRMNPQAKHYLSPVYKYYEKTKDGTLIIPRGVRPWLEQNFKVTCKESTQTSDCEIPDFKGELREYQKDAPDLILKETQGIWELETGWGKTVLGLYIATILKQKTLVIVPNNTIAEQWREDCPIFTQTRSGLRESESPIHVLTIQSILRSCRNNDVAWLHEYGLVLFDEAQGSPSEQAKRIWRFIPARYRYGLSGTPDRTDGQGEAIRFIFGETLIQRSLERPKPRVHLYHYQKPGLGGVYHEMIDELIGDEERNAHIADIISSTGKKTLVLTKRIEHYNLILDKLPKNLRCFTIDSTLSPKKRKALLDSLRKDIQEYDVILGTFSLLGVGLDIPSLDAIVLAGDLKSHVLTKQAIGRIGRLFNGSTEPEVHDIIDINNTILFRQSKVRKQLYKTHNWELKVCQLTSKSSTPLNDRLRMLFSG